MDTERQIQENLRNVTDVTKIIIGHRVSSVRDADEILILQDGKVAERGTHETLWEKKGYLLSDLSDTGGSYLKEGEKNDGGKCNENR